jgi:hypothetical protein
VDRGRPLGNRGVERREVHLLEGLPPEELGLNVSQQHDHRRGILPGGVHPDGQVGGAHASRSHRHRRHPGQLGIGLRHERGARFVAGGDERELWVLLHGVYDLEEALPGDGIEALDAGPREHLDGGVSRFDPGASSHRILPLPGNLVSFAYQHLVTNASPHRTPYTVLGSAR